MKNIPKTIYLNLGNIGEDVFNEESFKDLAEITWCEFRIDKWDIEYKLVTTSHKKVNKANQTSGGDSMLRR